MKLPLNSWVFIASETLTAFVWTLGALFLYMIVKNQKFGLDTKIKKRTFSAAFTITVVIVGMFAGLAIGSGKFTAPNGSQEGGHGWGNPSLAIGMAMAQIQHVFRDTNVLFLGILYALFEFIGGALAGVAFFLSIGIHNKFSSKEEFIDLKETFTWSKRHPMITAQRDGIGAFLVLIAFLGGSFLAAWPTAFPNSDISKFTAILGAAMATGLAVMIFGYESLITLNPAVWLGALVTKFFVQKKITVKELGREMMSPVSIIAATVITGLGVYGLINLEQG